MLENILNVFLIIENEAVIAFRAVSHQISGDDKFKINLLKEKVAEDFSNSKSFEAPKNKLGKFMTYNKFAKLESQGMQYRLFEEIFEYYDVPENPLICVTPVVDGKLLNGNIEE
ncbi:MAG: hypothetical protein KJ799_05560 [Bacteroidetes bacterium]|nr:hypothetical protein [Bacteroidota bacterium]MBU1677445.1 hypothetical protein [Bacteroidota bacterium]MBU2506174.1 hypothetical protein [Bacteroidota bacterium]